MATLFKNKVVKNIGKLPITAISTDASTRSTIVGIVVSNLTSDIIKISLIVGDDTSVKGYYLKDVVIPTNATLKVLGAGDKLILAPENSLEIQADEDDACDAVISYVDIV